jgi:tetratricopeptide (TPR) repeat protein
VIALRGLKFKLVDASSVSARDLTRIDVCSSIASSLSLIDPIRGNLFHAKNLLAALRAGEPRRISRALALEVSYSGTAGGPHWEKTVAVAAEARRVAELVGDRATVAWPIATSAVAHYLAGRFEEALAKCLEAEPVFAESEGSTWEALTMRLFAIQALAHMGRFAELKARQEAALRIALERGDLYAAVNLRIGHPSMAWLITGDVARVRQEARAAMRQWSSRGFHLEHYYELIALTNADLYDCKARDALERLASKWPELEKSFLMRVQIIRLYARNMRARAAVATAEGEPAARATLLATAERETRVMERESMPWTAASASLIQAGAARLRGDVPRAIVSLERAIEQAEGVKEGLLAAAARHALGVCRGGAEGEKLIARTREELEAEGAVEPLRLVAMVAPGFGAGVPGTNGAGATKEGPSPRNMSPR